MWVVFNKNGQLIEKMEGGSAPRVGDTSFSINCVFPFTEDISVTYPNATITLQKPGIEPEFYPVIMMEFSQAKEYSGNDGTYLKNGTSYKTFYFDFSSLKYDGIDDPVILLDTAGTWKAFIKLFNSDDATFVQGTVSFAVEGASLTEETDLSLNTVLNNIATELAKKLNISGGQMTGKLYMGWDNALVFGSVDSSSTPLIYSDAGQTGTLTEKAVKIEFASGDHVFTIPTDETTDSVLASRNWVKSGYYTKDLLYTKIETESLIDQKLGLDDYYKKEEADARFEPIGERERAEAVEASLQESIDAEISGREEADAALIERISSEEERAKSAEKANSDAIDAETSARSSADEAFSSRISAIESDYLTSSDKRTLESSISSEVERAKGAEKTNADAISAETGARESADTVLQDNINAEASARSVADSTLQDQIDNLKARGRYLSQWNAVTGKPETEPTTLPYTYKAGDYFIVGTIGSTNYRPSGSSYTGTASTTAETESVAVDDVYYYDGSVWHLQLNTQKIVRFANIAGSPYDNTNLKTALDAKQGNLSTTQLNAVNSGITEDKVLSYGTHLSDSDIHVTTEEKNAWSGKQDTLVSGINIKTINNESLLGSGNIDIISVQWGNITGTISDQADLKNALDTKQDMLTFATNAEIDELFN